MRVHRLPYMVLVDKGYVGMVGVINMLNESHGRGVASIIRILNIEAVTVYGKFGCQDYFNNKLPYVFFFNRDVVEEYRGWFKWEVVVGDKVDDLLGKLPVFNGIWACNELVFRGLDLINAQVAESIIWIFGLIRSLE